MSIFLFLQNSHVLRFQEPLPCGKYQTYEAGDMVHSPACILNWIAASTSSIDDGIRRDQERTEMIPAVLNPISSSESNKREAAISAMGSSIQNVIRNRNRIRKLYPCSNRSSLQQMSNAVFRP